MVLFSSENESDMGSHSCMEGEKVTILPVALKISSGLGMTLNGDSHGG